MTPSALNSKSEVRKLKAETSRRDFLALCGRGALWATAGGTVVALLHYLSFTETTPPQVFVLDEPSTYSLGTITPVAGGRAFIQHDERGLYALNATCTHLGCLVKQAQAGYECPCHGSRFSRDGAVINGPATQPLNYSALALNDEGQLVLDLSRLVGAEVRLPIA